MKNSCKNLELHLSRCREVLPLCEQVMCAGIGFPELMAYHAAVMKKADIEKISYRKAAYALMDGIDTYEKLIDAKKQLNDTIMEMQMINLFLARQNYAVNTLMKLQFYGITENQILNLCKTIETNGLQSINSNSFSAF